MRNYIICLSLLAGFIMTGCTNTQPTGFHNVVDTKGTDSTDPRVLVIYGDKEFENKLLVVRKIVDDSNTLSRVSVTLQNISQDTFVVEYQFQWLEASGMPIMQTPAWHRVTLAPNAVKPLINVAKVPDAFNVEFTVRTPLSKLYKAAEPEKKKKK